MNPNADDKASSEGCVLNRRTFLTGAGAVIILAGGGLIWRAADRGVFTVEEGPAYEMWKQSWPAGRTNGGHIELVRAAVLAANPHNSQPWLFRVEPGRIQLFADRTRSLRAIDPDERELMLGLGCALENLMIAAEALGYKPDVALLPEGPAGDMVASVSLQPADAVSHPLFAMIPKRRTNRSRFVAKAILDNELNDLTDLAQADPTLRIHLFVKEGERAPVADLILRAAEIQAKDRAQHEETASWFRMTPGEIQRHRDGITLDAGGNPPLMRAIAKMVVSKRMIDGPGFGNAFVKSTKVQVDSAAAFAVVSAESKSPEACLRSGRLYQRIHLWAMSRGIALQPMNYPLENRPEMAKEVAAVFGTGDRAVLIPFRLGYGPEVPHSPRRALADVIIS
ncbi:MAG: hypothetical protein C4532_05200 [Candidatus Abyssobacteria bacterium SURF_17]|uniref:Nitroreductase domain-containing protein n=1 Tax=Candidatus Abyssobacteria bacterium SURF_17 TaxID=2093361 RepID=A0A419F333_9BACT|nr:MAG: hypothetical protein C4532_05200 [Candidatus Abyssubacteria bacterium SURF_17]